jgi:hypothetical protein
MDLVTSETFSDTTMSVVEKTTGAIEDVPEVQVFTITATSGTNTSTAFPYGTFDLQYGLDTNSMPLSLEASADDFKSVLEQLANLEIGSLQVRRTAADDVYSWTVTFPARYGRATLMKIKSTCDDSFKGDYDTEFHSRNMGMNDHLRYLYTADSWSGTDCNTNDTFSFSTARVVPGSAVVDGTLSVSIEGHDVSVPLFSAADSLGAALQESELFADATVTAMKHPDNARVDLILIDFVTQEVAPLAVSLAPACISGNGCSKDYAVLASALQTDLHFSGHYSSVATALKRAMYFPSPGIDTTFADDLGLTRTFVTDHVAVLVFKTRVTRRRRARRY